MELTERTEGGVTILDLVGRLRVEDGVGDFRASIAGLIAKGCSCLVLNLERCPYVDSAGLGELATALVKARKAGGQVVLVNVPDRVLELLRITRLTDVFTICQDERSALAAVQSV